VRLFGIMWQTSVNCPSYKDKHETMINLGVTNTVKKKDIA